MLYNYFAANDKCRGNNMNIKVRELDYTRVQNLKREKRPTPLKTMMFFRVLLKLLSWPTMKKIGFECKKIGMDRLGKKEPALFLMNHSSFTDMKIASSILFPRPFNIVCTSDGFVGKHWLMRLIGCIPTRKFMTDTALVRDMVYALHTLKSSVLLYPEAGYSFDGRATVLPDSLGKCIKLLNVPVVMIETDGAFLRDPLYNGLQIRKVKVTAEMRYALSCDDIKNMSVEEINGVINESFSFDYFKKQKENGVEVTEPFRADGLERVLYKCPHCQREGTMVGKGTELFCTACKKSWDMLTDGSLSSGGKTEYFDHIPDWYDWQRQCVRREIEDGNYGFSADVDILMLAGTKKLYRIGEGTLTHSKDGILLTGCNGMLSVKQSPTASYSLNADYLWYEIGDMICIGDSKALYYCFPKGNSVNVTKARLATEEIYKITKAARRG